MVATGISLNERFTQMQSKQRQQQQQGRGRSRSRSRSRRIVDSRAGNTSISAANSRLLQEFKRRHTVQTALKLKRVCVPQNLNLNRTNRHAHRAEHFEFGQQWLGETRRRWS